MTKEKRKKLLKLIKQWTKCEIMARHFPFGNSMEFGDYVSLGWEKRDKILKLLYGTSNLVKLGEQWGILKPSEKKKK